MFCKFYLHIFSVPIILQYTCALCPFEVIPQFTDVLSNFEIIFSVFDFFKICFHFFFLSFSLFFFVVVQVQLSQFSLHNSLPPPVPTCHTGSYPLLFCPCVLYICSLMTLPLFPPVIPLPSSL